MFNKKIVVTAVLGAISMSALAEGFSISPLLVDIQTKGVKRSTSFEVNNDDALPVKMEMKASDWSQPISSEWSQDGKNEVYADTKDLTFFPKVFTVAPHSKQVVRVSYKGDLNINKDNAYRLWFSEIKESTNAKKEIGSNSIGAVVTLSYRIGAGIFVQQTGKPTNDLSTKICANDKGEYQLIINNLGNTHLSPSETKFKLTKLNGDVVEIAGPPTWHILPGVERTFTLKDFKCKDYSSASLIIDGIPARTIPTTLNCN